MRSREAVYGFDFIEMGLSSNSSSSDMSEYGLPEKTGGVSGCKDETGASGGMVLLPMNSCSVANGGA
jgi:hypothetical protein